MNKKISSLILVSLFALSGCDKKCSREEMFNKVSEAAKNEKPVYTDIKYTAKTPDNNFEFYEHDFITTQTSLTPSEVNQYLEFKYLLRGDLLLTLSTDNPLCTYYAGDTFKIHIKEGSFINGIGVEQETKELTRIWDKFLRPIYYEGPYQDTNIKINAEYFDK